MKYAQSPVACNEIGPDGVGTLLGRPSRQAAVRGMALERVVQDIVLAAQPTRCFVTVEEFASLALFLCGESARSMTRASIPIDGGWTAQ